MRDTRNNFEGGVLDLIKILVANGANGRLDVTAGTTEGIVFFKDGQLVDARFGHLTGFPAVNAVAAIRDARFNFDPTAIAPRVSSISPSERVVLKQFFGIDTIEHVAAPDDELTIETSRIPVEPVEAIPTPAPEAASSNLFFRAAMVFVLLFIVIAVAAVTLRNKYRERALPATVATSEQPALTEQPTATEQQPAAPSLPAEVNTNNLTGKWSVVNTIQKTSFQPFRDLKIGFDLAINQSGNSFTGKGQKVSENGRSLPVQSRTPIEVKGSINGNRVEATFFENGSVRKTNGRFVWQLDSTGGLNGTFISTAANTSGKSAAKREL